MHNVAIIGAGLISSWHIEAYLELADLCRITALSDIDEEKARAQVRRYGLDARVETDYRRVAEDDRVELVSVCVPPFAHTEVAVSLLESGKHVLLEKPMAPSLAECDRIAEAACASSRVLSVVSQKRFDADVQRAKAVIDAGSIGRVLHGQADSFWWRGNEYYRVPWRGKWETEGGGCVFIHAVHHLDLLQWFMGMPRRVYATVANTTHASAQTEDLASAILEYDDGRLAHLTASLIHHGEEQRVAFQGERASVRIPWKVLANVAGDDGFPEEAPQVLAEVERAAGTAGDLSHTGHAGQIADVIGAVEAGREPLCAARDGRNTIELITAIYAAAERGMPMNLPLGVDHPFYPPGSTQTAMATYMRGL